MVKKSKKSVAPVRSTPSRARWFLRPWGAASIVFVVSIALYANTASHDFVWDDRSLIVDNHAVRTLDGVTLKEIFTEDSWRVIGRGGGYYRPLITLSYHVNYSVFNGDPRGFHVVNIIWNAATCVLAFIFVTLLFRSVLLGLCTALLFAVHPIHTEAVAWISGRTDILASLWSLASLSFYVLARRRGTVFFAPALLAFVLALLAKESAAALPLIVLVLETGSFQPLFAADERSQSGAPRFAGAVVFFAVLIGYIAWRVAVIGTATSGYESYAPGALGYLALPLSVFGGYIYKVLVPFRLEAEYDAAIPGSFGDPSVLFGLVMVAVLAAVVWRYRRYPQVVLGTAIFVLGLSPVMNVIPIGEVSAERFLYFSSLGTSLIVGSLVCSALLQRSKPMPGRVWSMSPSAARFVVILSAIAIVTYGVRTMTRNPDWSTEAVLFARTVAQDPENPRAQANVARVALRNGDAGAAIAAYQKAIQINPDYSIALNGLAEVYARQGRYDEAEPLIRRAIAASPDEPKFVNNLGSLYYETARYQEAVAQFEQALSMNPDELRAHFNLGLIQMRQGNTAAAYAHFVRTLEGGEDFNDAHIYIAVIKKAEGDIITAKQHAREFLRHHDTDDAFRSQAEKIIAE